MEKLHSCIRYEYLRILFCLTPALFFIGSLSAQDKKVDIDIGVNKDPVWYQQPWAWVLGAAVFILLLIAILRSGKKG